MKKCKVCGMAHNANPAHTSDYKGIGAHDFEGQAPPEGVEVSEDIVVNFGGEVKAVGENGFEGYLVRYSDENDPDLVGDFFTKSTEFFVEDGAVIPLLYDHGLNPTMKKTKIGRAKVSYTDEGLFIKGELETADNYQKFVKEIKDKLINPGKAGLSSGAASHLVTRKQIKKGLNEILHWGIAEGSVTPAATEPKNVAVSLKSYFDERPEDPIAVGEEEEFKTIKQEGNKFVLYSKDGSKKLGEHDTRQEAIDQEIAIEASKKKKTAKSEAEGNELDPEDELALSITTKPIKALFEEKLKEKTPSVWEIRSVLDDTYKDIAQAAAVTDITGVTVDVETKVKESKLEEAAREIPLVVKQINDWVEKGGSGNSSESRYFYIRSLGDTLNEGVKGSLGNGLVLDEHSERVVSAVEEYANLGASLIKALEELEQRCRKKIEFRQNDPMKSGRTLSKATTEKLKQIREKVNEQFNMKKDLTEKLDTLLALAEPKKAPDPIQTLQMDFALTRNQTAMNLEELPVS